MGSSDPSSQGHHLCSIQLLLLGLPPAPPVKGITDTRPPYQYLGNRSL